jgi:hypothetical protein
MSHGERRDTSETDAIESLSRGMDAIGVESVDGATSTGPHRSGRSLIANRSLRLTEENGLLHWELPGTAATTRGSRKPVRMYRFEEIAPNQVSDRLRKLDQHLTPDSGLRQVAPGSMAPGAPAVPSAEGRILLFIHGTFSNCDTLVAELAATASGREFLGWATSGKFYDQVLTFDHPTLSVSPVLNAVQLAREFDGSRAQIDVVCHSRGGLITRWWLEVLTHPEAPARRAVFVGSPLAGTGLAAPAKMLHSLDLIANFAKSLAASVGLQAGVYPMAASMFHASAGLATIVASICAFGSRMSLLDAAIAMIPGLAAQSRQGANGELLSLREAYSAPKLKVRLAAQANRYAFVMSNFESDDPGWKFWKYFRNVKAHIVDSATNFIFDGENDLVVDSRSMCDLADETGMPAIDSHRQVLDFKTTNYVHHCNYFLQPETLSFIRRSFDTRHE